MFVSRDYELSAMEKLYSKDKFQMAVIGYEILQKAIINYNFLKISL